MPNLSRIRLLVTAATVAAFAGACRDANPNGSGLPTDAGAGIYPSMTVSAAHGTTHADLALRQVPGGLSFGSFQGQVLYDATALTLKSVTLPDGVTGAANEVSPGQIRFAGLALDGTEGAPVLKMEFAAKKPATKESFSVSFEEVTTAGEFADVTAQVKNGTLLYQQR